MNIKRIVVLFFVLLVVSVCMIIGYKFDFDVLDLMCLGVIII